MTSYRGRLHAWQPFFDASECVGRLCQTDYAERTEWRIFYFGSICLLRAVGHVLDKVDTREFPLLKSHIKSAYDRWKLGEGKDAIFLHLINNQRNLLLKEYAFEADPADAINIPIVSLQDGDPAASDSIDLLLVREGHFEGEAVDDLMWNALDWWLKELQPLEYVLNDLYPVCP